MRYLLIILILIVIVGAGFFYLLRSRPVNGIYMPSSISAPSVSPAPVGINSVTISNYAFTPKTITVPVGTTVIWINQDSVAHNIKSDTFNSDILNQGDTFEHTFNTAGIYNYSCSIHPSMTGTVVVQ